jgi:predicted esterase
MDEADVTCDIVYKQIAGTEATLDLYLPAQAAADAALPTVVFVHGNGDISEFKPIEEHWKRDQYTAARVVAALGYAAISFDYRGYDLPERLADAEQDVLDLLAYIDSNAARLGIDPDRICLWSVSGGGLPAAWASVFGDPQPICTVLISAGFAGAPSDADPVSAIGAAIPPIFLAHGAQDAYANPDRFVEAVTVPDGMVTVETHPGRHGWESTADADQQRIMGLALEFVVEHLEEG